MKNKLLYGALGVFAFLGLSVNTLVPNLFLYYGTILGMKNAAMVTLPAAVLGVVVMVLYGKAYDMLGFKTSAKPAAGMLAVGFAVLYFSKTAVPVFTGFFLMMSGYLTTMAVFGAKLRDAAGDQKVGKIFRVPVSCLVLLLGVLGPAFSAWVLYSAGTMPDARGKLFLSAFLTIVCLVTALTLIFRMIRLGHYELWTEAGEQLQKTEELPWQEHPRPQLKRTQWMSLNGQWKLDGAPIRVPFPPQSQLSGYGKTVPDQFTCEKRFVLSEKMKEERILLHFEAVDQIGKVFFNEKALGIHEGGYLRFSYDVTDWVNREGENVLQVQVTDTLSTAYPYGKQCKNRGGMWYTPVSGIWKSVWLEAVPKTYIERMKMTPDLSGVHMEIFGGEDRFSVEVLLENGQKIVKSFENRVGYLRLSGAVLEDGSVYEPKLWTPDTPYLYAMTVISGEDRVETYFALRTMEIRNIHGINRVCLNGEPIFLHGVLDQGYFPDGIFLPAEEREYDRDILRMKELGFNLLRKHIKIEPDYFYYACDRLGMLVMQDMVNNGPYRFVRDTIIPTLGNKKQGDRTGFGGKRKQFFISHVENTIEQIYNHPSIVAYTIFNEGWGQFESDFMYEFVKSLDSTRLADATSGWFAQEKNDFDSEHIYFKSIEIEPKERPMFMSECGGYSMAVEGHYYSRYNTYGYGGSENREKLTEDILSLYDVMILPAAPKGMCGCIYTQLSDVEDEINGLYTYDRKVCKVEKEKMAAMAKKLQKAVSGGG